MSEFGLSRRDFLQTTGASALALSFGALGVSGGQAEASEKLVGEWNYGAWEDLFREEWVWDKITFGTHLVDCYPGNCSWHVYTKDGVVWREEQVADYAVVDSSGPDWNPRGCQKGCTYSNSMYNPDRLEYPMKRVGERGEGKWKRISWDEASTLFADGLLDAVEAEGPESIIFEPGPANGGWFNLFGIMGIMGNMGATTLDVDATIGDFCKGVYETFGKFQFMDSCDAWYFAKLIIIWQANPIYTWIPSYHFIAEARYSGAEIFIIAPDYSPSAIHCDEWVPVVPATDSALALGLAQVLIEEDLIDVPFVKEQSDFPFLIRSDTERYLRASDMEEGGLEDQFYYYDPAGEALVKAPRDTLKLPVDPALDGTYSATLLDGSSVEVRPSFAIFKDMLDRDYTPEKAGKICGAHPDTIRRLARKAGAAGGHVLIVQGAASPKTYHGDLIHRGMCLLLTLTGSLGNKGCGIGGWNTSGLPTQALAGNPMEKKRLQEEILAEDPSLSDEMVLREIEYRSSRAGRGSVPPMFLYYFHSGYKESWDNAAWHDTDMVKSFGEYMEEAIEKGWWEGRMRPAADQKPQAYVFFATNPARKNRGFWKNIYPNLWNQYKFICGIDVRMSTTCLLSDLILPGAGYYEKLDVRFPTTHVPWLTLTEAAVDPPGEAMPEWDMAQLLYTKLLQRAKERGLTKFKSRNGIEHDLEKGAGMLTNFTLERLMNMILMANAASGVLPKGTNLETLRKSGKVRFTRIALESSVEAANLATDIKPDEPVVPLTYHTGPKKIPYPTYARRIQFYIDHPWFIESGEAHPVHKDDPSIGGDYPLRMTSGHQRWSIHSSWVTSTELLKTHQGRPFMFMNPQDAKPRGIEDGDLVHVHNDFDDFKIHVKISPSPRPEGRLGPGQVIIYHAWEPFQFEDWKSYDSAIPGMMKWNDMAGGYGHLEYYAMNWCTQPIDRPTAVEVEKA